MTCELKHTFTDHKFKDRESLGCIPMYTKQEKTNIFPSSILAYKKIKGKKTQKPLTLKKKKKGSSVQIIMKAITIWRSKLPSSQQS